MTISHSTQKVYSTAPIAVAGATGKQGGAVARHLLRNGHNVRALTRSPEKDAARELATNGAEVVACDLEDRSSINAALKGAAGLFSVQDFLEAGIDAELRQGRNLTDAAAAIDSIEHVVYSGASTMDRNTGVPHLDSKWQIEQRLRASGKTWTVFRPAAFLDNWEWDKEAIMESGTVRYPMRPEMLYRQIACDDIGAMVAQAFEQPGLWANRAAPLAGDARTMLEITAIIGEALGRDLRYEQISESAVLEEQGEDLMLMYRSFDTIGMDGDPVFLEHWLGRKIDLPAYLKKAGWN